MSVSRYRLAAFSGFLGVQLDIHPSVTSLFYSLDSLLLIVSFSRLTGEGGPGANSGHGREREKKVRGAQTDGTLTKRKEKEKQP